MRSPLPSLFTSPSLSPPACPAVLLCVIHPGAIFQLCGFPCSCGDGGSHNFVPVCKVSTWVALKKVTCTWLSEVFSNFGLESEGWSWEMWYRSWSLLAWFHMVTGATDACPHTLPLLVPLECPSISFPSSPSGSLVKKKARPLCRGEQTASQFIRHCSCQVQAMGECSETDTALVRTYIKCPFVLLARDFWLGREYLHHLKMLTFKK